MTPDYLKHNWLHKKLLLRDLSKASKYANGLLLDIGCGHKPYLEIFSPLVSGYVGLDHSDTQSNSAVVDLYADVLKLPFQGEVFGTVLCSQVLEHLPEPWHALAEANRVLQPGGHLILSAPHIWNVHEAPDDYYRFTRYGLEYLLKMNGFEVVELMAQGGYFATASQRFSYYLHNHHRRNFISRRTTPFICALVQRVGLALDNIRTFEDETQNYVIVGRKLGKDTLPASRSGHDKEENRDSIDLVSIMSCPACGGSLVSTENTLECAQGNHSYHLVEGIPRMETEITARATETPNPQRRVEP